MLKIYDYLDDVIHTENFISEPEKELAYSVHDVMNYLGFEENVSFAQPLERALKACVALGIPIKENFRKVYCCTNGKMQLDIHISPTACYLFMINCDPNNPLVAKAQLHMHRKDSTA